MLGGLIIGFMLDLPFLSRPNRARLGTYLRKDIHCSIAHCHSGHLPTTLHDVRAISEQNVLDWRVIHNTKRSMGSIAKNYGSGWMYLIVGYQSPREEYFRW